MYKYIITAMMLIASTSVYAEKDRYDIRKLQNDPEVLVSVSKHQSYIPEIPVQGNVDNTENDDVVVYASLEDSTTGEETLPVKCSSEGDTIICSPF